jgi:AcrR family transcriptional regulator
MLRPSRFSEVQILDATAALVAAGGPGAATIGAISQMLKAPSGSIYHRFASRDTLLGRLWLNKAAFFQNRFAAALATPDPAQAGLAAALSMLGAVRDDFAGARIMLLHQRDDFLDGDWPPDMAALDALEPDHAFLLRGDVFTSDVIETWLDYKRKKEIDAIRLRPHPHEFHLYYDI